VRVAAAIVRGAATVGVIAGVADGPVAAVDGAAGAVGVLAAAVEIEAVAGVPAVVAEADTSTSLPRISRIHTDKIKRAAAKVAALFPARRKTITTEAHRGAQRNSVASSEKLCVLGGERAYCFIRSAMVISQPSGSWKANSRMP